MMSVASEYSFDIVSKIDLQEMNNAIVQAQKEIANRFDFKGSKSKIELDHEDVVIVSDDEYKLNSVIDILQSKMVKRGVPIKNTEFGKVEPAASGTVRQTMTLKQGIGQDDAKKMNKMIRDSKLKVKSQIQGDQLRVSGKSKDDLQKVMQLLREADLPLELQFVNFR